MSAPFEIGLVAIDGGAIQRGIGTLSAVHTTDTVNILNLPTTTWTRRRAYRLVPIAIHCEVTIVWPLEMCVAARRVAVALDAAICKHRESESAENS